MSKNVTWLYWSISELVDSNLKVETLWDKLLGSVAVSKPCVDVEVPLKLLNTGIEHEIGWDVA